jgi:hypothetical protein
VTVTVFADVMDTVHTFAATESHPTHTAEESTAGKAVMSSDVPDK